LINTILSIEGMHCASCASRIEKQLNLVPGVHFASVNLASNKAYIQTEDHQTDLPALEQAVHEAGYAAHRYISNEHAHKAYDEHETRFGWRLILGGFLALPLLAHHVFMNSALFQFSPWIQLCFAAPLYFVVGWPFHQSTLKLLLKHQVSMDTLISLGTSVAFFGSLPALWGWRVDLYFDATGIILFLVTLGRFLENRSKQRVNRALEQLVNLAPRTAHVRKDTHQIDLPVEMVGIGDQLCIRPGESIPVDGEVLEGKGFVDESFLTGESTPVEKRPGRPLFAGTINGTTTLIMRAESIGADTALSRMIRLVEEAQGSKAPVQKMADNVAAIFVPVVLLLAAATLWGWLIWGKVPLTDAFQHVVAVLVIACPCALGLATPIAVMAGVGLAAQKSILIRRAEVLEKTRKIDVLVFDKTGTLTEGRPRLMDVMITGDYSEEQLLRYAGALEMGTNHPLAAAILKEVMVLDLILPKTEKVIEAPGAGVQGWVEGRLVAIGTKGYIESLDGVVASAQVRSNVEAYRQGGQTVSLMAIDQKIAAIFVMEDALRAESKEVVTRLKKLGLQVHLLTGDGEVVARRVADRVGADEVKSNVLPEGKVQYIKELQSRGLKVAMVGDGYNDAAALTTADLGIAMGTGTDVAKEAGDIVLVQGDLLKVVEAIQISRATFNIIWQNLFWAFSYNLLALPLAIFTQISPSLAAGAMALSSLTVVLNTLRLFGKKF